MFPARSPTHPFLNATGEVDDRHVRRGNTESHSSQFSVEARNHFSHSLGGSCRRRDDVGSGRSTTTPVLVARPVDRLLDGRVRVHGRHQGLDDVVLLVDDFGQRGQTVGRARRVAVRHTAATSFQIAIRTDILLTDRFPISPLTQKLCQNSWLTSDLTCFHSLYCFYVYEMQSTFSVARQHVISRLFGSTLCTVQSYNVDNLI